MFWLSQSMGLPHFSATMPTMATGNVGAGDEA
jgi:hypothetical protein